MLLCGIFLYIEFVIIFFLSLQILKSGCAMEGKSNKTEIFHIVYVIRICLSNNSNSYNYHGISSTNFFFLKKLIRIFIV